jgi:C4-dicarboxylate-specific signal transduction histidine kinase
MLKESGTVWNRIEEGDFRNRFREFHGAALPLQPNLARKVIKMATIKQLSTLLIVDDKPDNLFILQEVILQHLPQCETVTACSTQDGLEVAALKALDGALIDVQMPGMDGVEMCRRLKADPKTAYVPVILITSHRSSPKERAEGLEAGADDFISRPIDNIELVARINTILRMKRAEDQLRTGNADLEKRVAEKTAALSDRVKELNCLYAISSLVEKQDITLEEILQGIVGLVPPALQHPELTCARITLDGQAFKTENFSETARRKISDIVVHGERLGSLQVCCLGEKPKSDGCLFLKEEKGLIDAVAGRLGKIIERKRTEEEKKRLKAHLRQAQKMEAIGSLAGGIAHDFNNVLCPIIGYTELTLDSLPEGSKAVNYLNEVLNAAMRAKDLVQQILTFSRQSDPELKPLMVQPIVKETLKLLRASIPATIKITPDIDKNCSLILADPTQIHQLIVNLCTNAYHAMREKGGLLKVSLKETEIDSDDLAFHSSLKPGHYLQLGISDTGHGMDRSVMERIFDPYFTTKAPGEGTGLGLAVVHGIVKNYGGDIRVYSEPGRANLF